MSWFDYQENWATLIDLIALKLPHAERAKLTELDRSICAFAHYIAETHDLTINEAMETIEMVLMNRPKIPEQAARAA